MHNLANGRQLVLLDEVISETWDLNTPLDATLKLWDASRIVAISTRAPTKKGILQSHPALAGIAGGVIGGAIDAMTGDDSIVDGILVGGGLGLLFAGSSTDSPKREKIGVTFDDGSHLALEVDETEFVRLSAIANAGQLRTSPNVSRPALRESGLHPSTVRSILERRVKDSHDDPAHVITLIGIVLLIVGLFAGFCLPQPLSAISWPFSVVGVLVGAVGIFFTTRSPKLESFLRSDSERKVWASVSA